MTLVATFYADLVSALQKIESGDQSIANEIAALQASQANFEQHVSDQVDAAIDAKLSALGVNPDQLAAMQASIAALQGQVGNDEAAAGTSDGVLSAPVSSVTDPGAPITVSSGGTTSSATDPTTDPTISGATVS